MLQLPRTPRLALAATLLLGSALAMSAQGSASPAGAKIKVLIIDGQNNHAWAITTPLLRRILEDSGAFTVAVSTSPAARPVAPKMAKNATPEQQAAQAEKMKSRATDQADHKARAAKLWAQWRPKFSDYAVVISNYNGESWPAEVRAAFVDYVKRGGGLVSYHAANNAFPDWPEYNEMIGIGGWGGRNEKSGPYLRLRATGWIKDPTAGPGGGHGPQHEFVVEAREPDHPIWRGLPARWMHAKDELYHGLRGPANRVSVIASALSDRTKEHEPMLMAIPYGQGRVFHTTLGHAIEAINGLGFQSTFLRGTEWAATGRVTIAAPKSGALSATQAALREVAAP